MERIPLSTNGNGSADWTWPRQTTRTGSTSDGFTVSFDRTVRRLAWSVGATFVGAFVLGIVVGKWML